MPVYTERPSCRNRVTLKTCDLSGFPVQTADDCDGAYRAVSLTFAGKRVALASLHFDDPQLQRAIVEHWLMANFAQSLRGQKLLVDGQPTKAFREFIDNTPVCRPDVVVIDLGPREHVPSPSDFARLRVLLEIIAHDLDAEIEVIVGTGDPKAMQAAWEKAGRS
jgi:hypothetical protein